MIPLFDLHCDTLLSLYKSNSNIKSNNLHISYEKATNFSPYIQVGAIWSDNSLSDEEAYLQYLNVINYISRQDIHFAKRASHLREKSFILAVEDARICTDIDTIDVLYSHGVRMLGLNWSGINSIGGAWDTSAHLTDFGIEIVKKCCKLGIIVDISHSNEATSNEAIDLCQAYGGYVLASHSNAYGVLNHRRNISDELFSRLRSINSIVGISLASFHLGNSYVEIDQILKHIEHFLKLGGKSNICLGCDFDGVDTLPQGIRSVSDLSKLFEKIKLTFGDVIAKKIFFDNAYKFICRALN
ncbi:MAG: membrane dipeptidase [Clostridia bacterium]|nr:membrane dipeptidase [Clostridia bacterium]